MNYPKIYCIFVFTVCIMLIEMNRNEFYGKKRNEETIQEYCLFRQEKEQLSLNTIENQKKIIKLLSKKINKPFKKMTEADITRFLKGIAPNTRDYRIIVLKKFFRWLYNLEKDEKLPNCIRNFKLQTERGKKRKGAALKNVTEL